MIVQNRIVRSALWIVMGLAAAKGMYHLLAQAWFFFGGAYSGDAKYYWTVGRAILNDFTLYTDIFDTKPPAIYLLSAFSFGVFDSSIFGDVLNGMLILSFPILFTVTAHVLYRDRIKTLFGLLFGIAIALYTGFTAGAWQVELYGAFCGTLYVALLVKPLRHNVVYIAMLSLCIFCTIGFKEPFFLTLLGCALLLLQTKKRFLHHFVLPIALVGIAGVLSLVVFDFASGYFGTYLPSNVGHHMVRSVPVWARGLQVHIVAEYIAKYSYVLVVLLAFILYGVAKRGRWIPIALALYCAFTAGNLRGYPTANHFIAIVPLYSALFFLFIKPKNVKLISVGAALASLTLLSIPLSDGFAMYEQKLQKIQQEDFAVANDAAAIDALLDACDVDRYFFVEDRPYMHIATHSPLNFFVYIGLESIVWHHPRLVEKQLESLSAARIIIVEGEAYEVQTREGEKELSVVTQKYLSDHFTFTPWSCAEGIDPPKEYRLMYRKEGDTTPFPYVVRYL